MNVSSVFMIVTAIAIFVILVSVIYKSISEIPSFKGPIAFILTVCTALLCLIGMADLMVAGTAENPSETASHIIDIRLDFILLPYASLALTILLLLLVLVLVRIQGVIRARRKTQQTKREMRR